MKKLLILICISLIGLNANSQNFDEDIASYAKYVLTSVNINDYVLVSDTIESCKLVDDSKWAHIVCLTPISSFADVQIMKLEVDAFIKAICNAFPKDSFCLEPWKLERDYISTIWILHGHLVNIICSEEMILVINYHK